MLKLTARFAEYGLTGGFFVLVQIFLILTFQPSVVGSVENSDTIRYLHNHINGSSILKDIEKELLTATGVIGIFVVGLLLEMLSFFFIYVEIEIFSKHLDWFKEDLKKILAHCPHTIQREFSQATTDLPRVWSERRNRFLGIRIVGPIGLIKVLRFIPSYSRLSAFLITFSTNSISSSEALLDHIRTFRVTRAMSAVVVIAALEALVLFILPESYQDSPIQSTSQSSSGTPISIQQSVIGSHSQTASAPTTKYSPHTVVYSKPDPIIVLVCIYYAAFLSFITVALTFGRMSYSLMTSVWLAGGQEKAEEPRADGRTEAGTSSEEED